MTKSSYRWNVYIIKYGCVSWFPVKIWHLKSNFHDVTSLHNTTTNNYVVIHSHCFTCCCCINTINKGTVKNEIKPKMSPFLGPPLCRNELFYHGLQISWCNSCHTAEFLISSGLKKSCIILMPPGHCNTIKTVILDMCVGIVQLIMASLTKQSTASQILSSMGLEKMVEACISQTP